uniref:Nodule Cysteine-Rich (NCR) secreted peptide n=1 Tax=Panagrellus redivivus TaxID=6233 RepID=A0A7E4WC09_PANRE
MPRLNNGHLNKETDCLFLIVLILRVVNCLSADLIRLIMASEKGPEAKLIEGHFLFPVVELLSKKCETAMCTLDQSCFDVDDVFQVSFKNKTCNRVHCHFSQNITDSICTYKQAKQ